MIAAFSAGALLVVSALSLSTYFLSRTYLVEQRERSAVRQARANARLVRSVLQTPDPDVPRLLSSLETPSSSRSLVNNDEDWVATSAAVGPDELPERLRDMVVVSGEPARQRFIHDGEPALAVGIPIGERQSYFEVFPLVELRRTLRTIEVTLVGGSIVAMLGSVAVGVWTSRRVLRPLSDIGETAALIAAGRLDARLDAAGDEELVALAAGFNAMVESLQERIERDARFASDVSHELRSPLTTMKSAVSVVAARRDSFEPRGQRALDLLQQEVHRFERMVRDLLEISKSDAGVAEAELLPVSVRDTVLRAIAASGIEVPHAELPEELHASADSRRLQQVVINLLSNAATHGGGVEQVSAWASGHRVLIAVDDQGPGVPAGEEARIFERFARAGVSGRRASNEGLGLGLALVAEHVALQNGRVWVESRACGGARFVVELASA